MLPSEDSGPGRVYRSAWRALGSALSPNSRTRVAPGVGQHQLSGPSAHSRPAWQSDVPRPRSSNLGTPEKLHADPPARCPLSGESSFQMRTARARVCPAALSPAPPAARPTHLGPCCPPRGVGHLPPGRLHPKGRALSGRAPAGAPGPRCAQLGARGGLAALARHPLRPPGRGRLLQSQPSPRGAGAGPCPGRRRPGPVPPGLRGAPLAPPGGSDTRSEAAGARVQTEGESRRRGGRVPGPGPGGRERIR